MEKEKNIIFYLAIIIIILSIIFIIKTTISDNKQIENNVIKNTQKSNNTIKQNTEKQGLYIKEHYMRNEFSKTIEGIVVNNNNKNYKYLQVEVQCYDKNNNKLQTTGDIISELNSNENWKFKIYVDNDTYRYNISIKEN